MFLPEREISIEIFNIKLFQFKICNLAISPENIVTTNFIVFRTLNIMNYSEERRKKKHLKI